MLTTTSIRATPAKKAGPEAEPAQASIPYILQFAINEVEAKFRADRDVHLEILVALNERLQCTLEALDDTDPGQIRPKRDVLRKLKTAQDAMEALGEQHVQARLEKETQAFIMRFRDLEQQEKDRKKQHDDKVKRSETRFMPAAPGSSTATAQSKKTRNYGSLIAQEMRYKFGLEQRPVDLIMFDMCPKCMVAMQYNVALQQLICPVPSCGYWKRFADMTSAALAYGEEIEFCKYSYNPLTHLDDTIKYAEAGEAYVVPPEHLEKVMSALYVKSIKPEDITIKIIRDIVYNIPGIKTENTVQIYSRLTGRSPWRLSTFAKDQVRIMFVTEEAYYRKHCGGRTNNLSYPYKLYKYCELLGYWEMLESLPLLRGASNLCLHDGIQAKINRDLDWEFIPTIKQDDSFRINQTLRKTSIIK